MSDFRAIANKYGIPVVEDAAEGFGSKFKGQVLGTFGKYGASRVEADAQAAGVCRCSRLFANWDTQFRLTGGRFLYDNWGGMN